MCIYLIRLLCALFNEISSDYMLQRISDWIETKTSSKSKLECLWLPLALFDSHSQFVLSYCDLCFDVGIDGDMLHVTCSDLHAEYRSVSFASYIEFEYFLRLELSRVIASS